MVGEIIGRHTQRNRWVIKITPLIVQTISMKCNVLTAAMFTRFMRLDSIIIRCMSDCCQIIFSSTTNAMSRIPTSSAVSPRPFYTGRKLTALWEWGISRCHTDHRYPQHAQETTWHCAGRPYLLLRSSLFQVSFVVAGRELRPGSPWPGALPDGCSRHECRWLGTDRGQRGAG